MRPHLRYLRYVLLHKLYVLRAGIAINGWSPRWLWRLLVHDLSKFTPAEWGPYVTAFYRERPDLACPVCRRAPRVWKPSAPPVCGDCGHRLTEREFAEGQRAVVEEQGRRKAAFNRAWLHHLHANPHHWQYWVLREDSGKTIILLPPAPVVDEMLADWMAAGSKILRRPTLRECVAETIVWYVANRANMQLRTIVANRVESVLTGLANDYGLLGEALALHSAAAARESIVIPGR